MRNFSNYDSKSKPAQTKKRGEALGNWQFRLLEPKIIDETIKDEKVKIYDESVGTKAREYVPWWA